MDWRHDAVCRDENPELFFPVGNSGPAVLQIAEAKAVCRRCPVASQCLAWALETGQDAGVWGGMSEDERRAMKRRAARSSASAAKGGRRPAGRLDAEIYYAVQRGVKNGLTSEDMVAQFGVSLDVIRNARALGLAVDAGEADAL